jgi:hypothetical protein
MDGLCHDLNPLETVTSQELYDIYASWTGQLHFYVVRELGRHVDVEFFPAQYVFRVYSGHVEAVLGTVMMGRPEGERSETVRVPRPEDNPSLEDLSEAFAGLCRAAARVLELDLGGKRLPGSNAPKSAKHALFSRCSGAHSPRR